MESLPKYTVYRSKRKSIRLVLRTNGTFAVYCPLRCSKQQIEEMVARNYKILIDKRNNTPDHLFSTENNAETLPFLAKRYPIMYTETTKFSFNGECFSAPIGCDKETIRASYGEILRKVAKNNLPRLTAELASEHGFKYNSVRIKAASSRFGSCSAKGNINLALALMACDTDFIQFVILHELCHTVHMNHSAQFYSLLQKVCPNHKELNERGKKLYSSLIKAINYRPCS